MPDGSNRGVVDLMDALNLARNMNMDLIEVASTASPPVCRIEDFGKFNYEREKKEREAKRNSKQTELKGIRLRPKTSEHHLFFKVRAAKRFLEAGNKVQVTMRFKGREDRIQHVALGMMEKVRDGCLEVATIEMTPRMEGRTMLMVMAPTQATLLAATNKVTQDRLARERAEDQASGYDEAEEIDDDEDVNDEADDTAETLTDANVSDKPEDRVKEAQAMAADARANVDFSDKEARREFNKKKRDKNRDMEQFGLP
jgi:translation initiation factor IF-3